MSEGLTMEFKVHLGRGKAGARTVKAGPKPAGDAGLPPPVPRLAKLLALAIRFEELVRTGEVEDFAAVADLGHVTRARVSQIMNLLNLAPDIQEAILCDTPSCQRVSERQVREIAALAAWGSQRRQWIQGSGSPNVCKSAKL